MNQKMFERLPKWAQEEIQKRDRQIERLREMVEDDGKHYRESSIFYETDPIGQIGRAISKHAWVTFRVNGKAIQASIRENSDGEFLDISGWGRLYVAPASVNRINVTAD